MTNERRAEAGQKGMREWLRRKWRRSGGNEEGCGRAGDEGRGKAVEGFEGERRRMESVEWVVEDMSAVAAGGLRDAQN